MRNYSVTFGVGLFLAAVIFSSCSEKIFTDSLESSDVPDVSKTFGTNLSLSSLFNYSSQVIPPYIRKSNAPVVANENAKAMLGRVLFYDKSLSLNNTVSCASCHQQKFAFSDTSVVSRGLNGTTPRHSMRLINSRYAVEVRFFWDERAPTLEAQTTEPIQDHIEMGFSGKEGNPNIQGLLDKLKSIEYYQALFKFVYQDENITELRLQECLAAFIRSIQSFDSKFDIGRVGAPNENADFQNFTAEENAGKRLFIQPPQFNANGVRIGGGAGCNGCHSAPEFDIAPNSLNNGVIGKVGGGVDISITRSPTLRDAVSQNGNLNGPLMHTGSFQSLRSVINHYNEIPLDANANLDPKLNPAGRRQNLALTETEKNQLEAFLKTLTGSSVYTAPQWSNPFLIKE